MAWLIRRLLIAAVLVVLVSILSFLLATLSPGSPYPWGDMNPDISPEVQELYRAKFHLDEPVHIQYLLLWRDFFTGQLVSLQDQQPVIGKIAQRLPATLLLNGLAMVMAFGLALPLALLATRRPGGWIDNGVQFLCVGLASAPGFWVGVVLVASVADGLQLPVLGAESYGLSFDSWGAEWLDRLWHLLLPAGVLCMGSLAVLTQTLRAALSEALGRPYVRTAMAKGVASGDVRMRHALRNALRPWISAVGLMLPAMLGGSVIIESIFAYPGMGRLAFEAVMQRDYATMVVLNFAVAMLVVTGTLLSDLLLAVVDPRVRGMG